MVGNSAGNITSSVAQLVVDTLMKTVPTGTYRINSDPPAGHEVVPLTYMIDMYEVRMSYWEEVYEWATRTGMPSPTWAEYRSIRRSPKRRSPVH